MGQKINGLIYDVTMCIMYIMKKVKSVYFIVSVFHPILFFQIHWCVRNN